MASSLAGDAAFCLVQILQKLMTYPLTPPPELVQQLAEQAPRYRDGGVGREVWLINRAYSAGADQELEACCEWLKLEGHEHEHEALRAARRPKPPSLKEQALEALGQIDGHAIRQMSAYVIYDELKTYADTIRKALEQLND